MEYKLKELIEVKHGYAFKSEYFSEEPTRNILLSPGNVKIGGGFNLRKKKYYQDDIDINNDYILSVGDIFITMTDLSKEGDTLGYPAKIPENMDYNFLHNQRLGRVILKKDQLIDLDYLYYSLCTREYRGYILGTATGSTVKHTSPTKILDYKFNVPELHVQKKVSSILSNLDKKISVNNKIIELLEQLSQTLFKQWFIHFEFPNERGEMYKSSGGVMIESELGEIPENWNVSSISDLCSINKGNYSKKDEWDFINYLDTSNITKNSINSIQLIDIEFDKVPSRAKRKLEKNDIVYSTVRPDQYHFGLIKEPVTNMLASTGFTVIRSNGSYPNDLIYLWITQDKITNHLQSVAEQSTSAYPSIKPADLGALKIIVPPKKELDNLNNVISKNHNLIWNYQLENKKISQIRDALLPKLFSGEIEILEETGV